MGLVEFLSNDTFGYPNSRGDLDIRKYLQQRFDAYNEYLSRQKTSDPVMNRILSQLDQTRKLSSEILEAIQAAYEGHPHIAYDRIEVALRSVKDHFLELSGTSSAADWMNPRGLYRARVGNGNISKRRDLFHIPFELREKVSSQRFSMPGVPCLYLGSSLYCCWEELGRPPTDSLQIAKLRVREDRKLSILTIGPDPAYIASSLSIAYADERLHGLSARMLENAAVYVSVCWPVIMACSIPVSKPKMPFVPEHVIPQLVLEWTTSSENIDGLQCPSIMCKRRNVLNSYTTNYIFPAKSKSSDSGLDETLADIFHITEPISWNLAKALLNHSSVINAARSSAEDFALVQGLEMNYALTEFGAIELLLGGMPFSKAE